MACMYSLPRTYLIFMYAIQFFLFIYLFYILKNIYSSICIYI